MSAQTFPRGCKRRIQTYLYKFVEMSSRVPAMSYLSWRQIEAQTHIKTQIWLSTILTLATKHLMITNKNNLHLHLKVC